jgi:hypothetical protein
VCRESKLTIRFANTPAARGSNNSRNKGTPGCEKASSWTQEKQEIRFDLAKHRTGAKECQTGAMLASELWKRNGKGDRTRQSQLKNFYLLAALIVLQKSAFSLNDSHSFNRAEHAHPQH